MVSYSIPMELTLDILSRLPAKSVARFHSVSKQWASILDSPYFKNLFLAKSSAQPRLIFAIEENCLWSFFSLPQHMSPYEKPSPSLVLTPEFHMNFPPDDMWWIFNRDDRKFSCGYASGLIYFSCMSIKQGYDGVPVICNPKSGRYEILPFIRRYRKSYGFFGFDPINKQYKVLCIAYPCGPNDHRIMTLGTRGMRWRKVECSLKHEGVSEGVCVNGVLFYLGDTSEFDNEEEFDDADYVIVCFDVRSEKFKFIYTESFCELINYNGKLGVIYYDDLTDDAIELRVWVLEDVEKQEWSKYSYTLRGDKLFPHYASVVGVISTGEIVLSMAEYTSKKPFYIYYFNPERNTIRRVEIQGFGEYHKPSENPSRVYVFLDFLEDCSRFYPSADHAEDLNVKDPKLLESSIYAPYVYKGEDEEVEKEDDDYGFPCFYGKRKKNKPDESRSRKGRKQEGKKKKKNVGGENRDNHWS
ncbi:F-box protein [Raphanus sativus]|uniref:F-box protein At1g47340-like n=1 Tax=Raphanus sativus TaxID=3726 RepID=A0A6J0KSV0_RAPSA|nr:F-box protein At1g47340-like [Raphanus sativus]KAJ4868412.1 F-box protein [Raphanus sativus]